MQRRNIPPAQTAIAGRLEATVNQLEQPRVPRADPNALLAIHEHGGTIRTEPLFDSVVLPRPVLPITGALAVKAQPHAAIRIHTGGLHHIAARRLCDAEGIQLHPIQPAAVRAHPQIALTIFAQDNAVSWDKPGTR